MKDRGAQPTEQEVERLANDLREIAVSSAREQTLIDAADKLIALSSRLAAERKDAERMRTTLIDLDMGGGLGFDRHQRIKRAIGLPYPEFCRHSDRCAGLSSCPRDPCCCD